MRAVGERRRRELDRRPRVDPVRQSLEVAVEPVPALPSKSALSWRGTSRARGRGCRCRAASGLPGARRPSRLVEAEREVARPCMRNVGVSQLPDAARATSAPARAPQRRRVRLRERRRRGPAKSRSTAPPERRHEAADHPRLREALRHQRAVEVAPGLCDLDRRERARPAASEFMTRRRRRRCPRRRSSRRRRPGGRRAGRRARARRRSRAGPSSAISPPDSAVAARVERQHGVAVADELRLRERSRGRRGCRASPCSRITAGQPAAGAVPSGR